MFAAFSVGSFLWYSFDQLALVAHGHCLQAEPVKLQGELQRFAPARPSIRVQAMARQIVLSN